MDTNIKMCSTEEEIKKYLDILHNYTNQTVEDNEVKKDKKLNVVIVKKVIVFLFIQVIMFVNLVVV